MTREKDKRSKGCVCDPSLEAADWVVRLNDDAESERTGAELEAWLSQDPANQMELDALNDIWDRFEGLKDHPLVLREMAPDETGTPHEASQTGFLHRLRQFFSIRPVLMPAGTLAAFLLVAAVLWGVTAPMFTRPVPAVAYSTRIGEQKTVEFEDGSQALLDTGTTLFVRFGKDVRQVDLVAGRAQFSVVHDEGRPFQVTAGNARVRVLGTVFDVFKSVQGKVVVSVLRGRVHVARTESRSRTGTADPVKSKVPVSQTPGRQILVPGQQVVVDDTPAPLVLQTVDMESLKTWAAGKFDFHMAPLKQIIPEVNRYLAHPIRIEDPELKEMRISLFFSRSDANLFAETLKKILPVTYRTLPDGSVLLLGTN